MLEAELECEMTAKDLWNKALADAKEKMGGIKKKLDPNEQKQKEAGRFWEVVERANQVAMMIFVQFFSFFFQSRW